MASREYYRKMSRSLSRVMDDIGVSEEAVMSRRRSRLIFENLITLSGHLQQMNLSSYIFGSQTEGTTTDGLQSDIDVLFTDERFNLIQDLNDWVPGKINLLMIQDELFPGYCKLQLLKSDQPYPKDVVPSDGYTFDEAGRVLLNHFQLDGVELHGPAVFSEEGDAVRAIRCKTWPNGYKLWSHQRKRHWPTPEMISYMENSGCCVVQVAHCMDEKKSESWRISTSLAERCLMFSLNITQIRCYTLIKMIVKTFIDPVIPDVISSYICKNLLFHCVENTRPDFWQESNLLRCVNQVLLIMLETIRCMNCPNYFNESINLLLGKVNTDNQGVLMGVIWKVLVSEGSFLGKISYDNINGIIRNNYYDKTDYKGNDCSRVDKSKNKHTLNNEIMQYVYLGGIVKALVIKGRFSQQDLMCLQNTMTLFALQGPLQYVSATFLFPFLCSHLATLKANEHILHGEMLSSKTSLLYELSLDSDVTSSRLKFASYLYCTGHFKRAISVLKEVSRGFVDGSIAVCGCDDRRYASGTCINMEQTLPIKCLLPSRVTMCLMFSQAERRCCPRELQYEMYRSTEQEKLQREAHGHDDWMDLACIDYAPYLKFLLYMAFIHMGLRELRLQPLELLKKYASEDACHRDTVYNLLGQCYEYENRFDEAFACFCKSLRVKPTNNAARWHIVLLLNTVYQND